MCDGILCSGGITYKAIPANKCAPPPCMSEISRRRINALCIKFSGGEGGYFGISSGEERALMGVHVSGGGG